MDTETTGVGFYDTAFAATIAFQNGESVQSFYFELEHPTAVKSYVGDPSVADLLRDILLHTPRLVFHNAKFDLQKLIQACVLRREDLTAERLEDTECAYHLLHEHQPKKLKVLAKRYLGASTEESQEIKKARKRLKIKVDEGLHNLPREVVVPYAVKDADFTLRLWQMFRPQLGDDLETLYKQEMELTLVLLDMETAGLRVDVPYLKRQLKEYKTAILKQELEIERLTGKKVWYPEKSGQKTPEGHYNPNAWQQTLAILHERDVSVTSTANDELKPLSDPFAQGVLQLRSLKKIYGTYFLALESERRGDIIHPNIRQHGTVTGRTSSGKAQDG